MKTNRLVLIIFGVVLLLLLVFVANIVWVGSVDMLNWTQDQKENLFGSIIVSGMFYFFFFYVVIPLFTD